MKKIKRYDTILGLHAARDRDSSLTWTAERMANGIVRVAMKGEIDENTDLTELAKTLKRQVELDMELVRRVNSAGVREWVNFMREVAHLDAISLSRCSFAIVDQLNMIFNFRGSATVDTFYAPYFCKRCDREVSVLLSVRKDFMQRESLSPPDRDCPRCGSRLLFDDIPERYFAFIVHS